MLHEESKGDNIGAMPKLLDFVKFENSTLLEPNMYAIISKTCRINLIKTFLMFIMIYDSLGGSLAGAMGRRGL